MTFVNTSVNREKLEAAWRDPRHKLLHTISRCTTIATATEPISLVSYWTWCGLQLTVDDVNVSTLSHGAAPTCLSCVVASIPDVVRGKE
jgi:hypothetical protein